MSIASEHPRDWTPVAPERESVRLPRLPYPTDLPLLGREEEARLIRLAQAGDRRAMDRLAQVNFRLVCSVARRYRCRSYSQEDLIQEGMVGLLLAIERFDPDRGCRLSTYALHWVRQAIARAAELKDRMIHVPAQAHGELRRLRKLREERLSRDGREPSDYELAQATGLPEERVQRLLGSSQEPVSLETLVGTDQDAALLEVAEDPDAVNPEQHALSGAYRSDLMRVISRLRPRERVIVEERYGLSGGRPRTLDELSVQFRLSREGVRQIEARAIRKLRFALGHQSLD